MKRETLVACMRGESDDGRRELLPRGFALSWRASCARKLLLRRTARNKRHSTKFEFSKVDLQTFNISALLGILLNKPPLASVSAEINADLFATL